VAKGVLLVNLGSPDSTSVRDVRKYLREFLMDGRVLDMNWFARFLLVNCVILVRRPGQSAHAYRAIWSRDGSPLVATGKNVLARLRKQVNVPVELAMRYQNPSISAAIDKLAQRQVDRLLLIPLFPHYAMSSFETAVERVKEVAARRAPQMQVGVLAPFYDHPLYISALVESARPLLAKGYDHLLFSFHGIPERHLRKSDPTGSHCLQSADCCQKSSPAHGTCYRAQCFKTMAAFVKEASVPEGKYSVAFQSRLGRDPWLKPYTDFELSRFPAQGIRRLLVICPSFVSDCLETLEEIGIRGRETFLNAGGAEFALIPCLNEHPAWIGALKTMVESELGS
jgi:ferrochelatase